MATDKDTFKMNTMQKNKLIAEFMGFELNDTDQYYVPNLGSFEDFLLQFHNNWNWLMKVVEKIESLGYFLMAYEFEDDEKNEKSGEFWAQISDKLLIDINSLINLTGQPSKLVATYTAVVEFIKWYNQQEKLK